MGYKKLLSVKFIFITLLIVPLGLVSYFKGFNPGVQVWGEPFFYINYSEGFIKRGVVGHVFGLFEFDNINRAIVLTHWGLSLLVSIVSYLFILKFSQSYKMALILSGIFFSSQFMPTLAYNTGYLDAYVFCIALVSTYLYASNRILLSMSTIFIGAFVHEVYFFICLPLLLFSCYLYFLERKKMYLLYIFFYFLAGILIVLLHDQQAAITLMEKSGLHPDVVQGMINNQFGQSFRSSFLHMSNIWKNEWGYFLKVLPIFIAPVFCFILFYFFYYKVRVLDVFLLTLMAFSPMVIFFIAWDLSRLLLLTQLSSLMTIYIHNKHHNPSVRLSNMGLSYMAVFLIAIFIMLPFVYSYFGNSGVFNGMDARLENYLD